VNGVTYLRLSSADALAFASHLSGSNPQIVKRHARLQTLVVRAVVLNALGELTAQSGPRGSVLSGSRAYELATQTERIRRHWRRVRRRPA
jgi:tRNA U55 pseudouridine synthase TruB